MLNDPKFMDLLNNKEFVHEMMSQETPEDVQRVFEAHGVSISLEEVDELGKAIAAAEAQGTAEGELTEDQLMNVAGGAIEWILVGKVVVAVVGAGISLYKWYKSR